MAELPPTTGIVPDSQNEGQQKLAAEFRNSIVDIQSKLFDKSAAYSNLIMVGGYAGAFTIWSYTKGELSHKGNVATALLLGLSLSVFIFFEIHKMVKSVLHYNEVRYLLNETLPLPEFFEKLNAIQKRNASRMLREGTVAAAACLAIGGVTSVAALAILFYNFLAVLLGWCLWP